MNKPRLLMVSRKANLCSSRKKAFRDVPSKTHLILSKRTAASTQSKRHQRLQILTKETSRGRPMVCSTTAKEIKQATAYSCSKET